MLSLISVVERNVICRSFSSFSKSGGKVGGSSKSYSCSLARDIHVHHDKVIELVHQIPITQRKEKKYLFSSDRVSVSNLISYQIGWGKQLITWYEAGLKGETPIMPGDGFIKWEYKKIAHHFYKKYDYENSLDQEKEFSKIVSQIVHFVEFEFKTGNLDKEGVWKWCSLQSGKKWPLSKWVKVNTVSPYKRFCLIIKNKP